MVMMSLVLLEKLMFCPRTVEVVVDQVPPLPPAPPTIVLHPKRPLLQVTALVAELQVESPAPKKLVVNKFVVEAKVEKKFVVVAFVVVEFVLFRFVFQRVVMVDEALTTDAAV